MTNKLTLKLFVATSFLHLTAYAEVDLSNGSFIHTETAGSLVMIYNSRSLHRGLLGIGWCSPFEDSIEVAGSTKSQTTLRLRDCRAGKIILFTLKHKPLRAPSADDAKVYQSGDQQISRANSKFKLTNGGTVKTFDRNGRLLEVKDERGKSARLIYDKNGFLKEVISKRTDSLALKIDPHSGRLVELVENGIDHQGARTRLTFLNGNLISVVKPGMAKYFSYDSMSNLIEVTDLKKTTSVNYDSSDRVTSVKTSPDCHETYKYTENHLQSQTAVTTNCRGINNKRLVDFFYSKESSGEISLKEVSSTYEATDGSPHQKLRSSRLPATQKTSNPLEQK